VGTTTISPVVSGTGLTNFEITSDEGLVRDQESAGDGNRRRRDRLLQRHDAEPVGVRGDRRLHRRPDVCEQSSRGGSGCGDDADRSVVSGSGLSNFEITPTNGSYEIKKAPVTATAGGGSGFYNGATQSPSACAVTGTYTGDLACTNNPASVGPSVGTTTISPVVSGLAQSNFEITLTNGSYEIKRSR
jgi:hypothetical protein